MKRKIDELGRVVLPVEMRGKLRLEDLDTVEITSTENEIIIKRAEDSCIFCDSTEKLVKFGKFPVCESCRKKIAEV